MTLAQFLLPGEAVLYKAPDSVYHRRTPFDLYITGERLLLYGVRSGLITGERAVAESLVGIESFEYSEGGLLSGKGRLDVRFTSHTLTLKGSPNTIKEVWRALQQHAPNPAGAMADEELTLVAPPPPLFDDQLYPPAQVEPLPAATPIHRSRESAARRHIGVIGILICLVAVATAAAGLYWRLVNRPIGRTESQTAKTAPVPSPSLSPSPTPVTLHLMDEAFTLEEGTHRAVKFNVPDGTGSARVSGGFRVTSGSYVDFYLMRREQYDRFAAGEVPDITSVLYREEQWNARVGERVPPGDYYFVFDNRDSAGGPQTVAAEFFLIFDQPSPVHQQPIGRLSGG